MTRGNIAREPERRPRVRPRCTGLAITSAPAQRAHQDGIEPGHAWKELRVLPPRRRPGGLTVTGKLFNVTGPTAEAAPHQKPPGGFLEAQYHDVDKRHI